MRRILVPILLTTLTACAAERPPQVVALERTIEPAPEITALVEGGLTDSILLKPGSNLDVRDGLIALIDAGRVAIEAFDTTGALLWVAGAEGDGPLEFRLPVEVGIDENGHVWVLDRARPSVTEIEPDGSMRAPVRLPNLGPDDQAGRMVVLDGGRLILESAIGGIVHEWSPKTGAVRTLEHPYTEYDELHYLVRPTTLARGPTAQISVFLYLGGGFGSVNVGETFSTLHPYVEGTPLPQVVRQSFNGGRVSSVGTDATHRAALDASVSGNVAYVLYEGATAHAGRLIDRYDTGTGRYLGSWLLDERASAVAADGELLVTVEGRTIPKLVIRRIPGG